MDRPFPIGFPPATILYLVLYVVTLAVHVVFMNYVLAGTAYLFLVGVRRGRESAHIVADRLRDWMPFALGVAITAGVAPLLFVQILYKENFYTANLLLLHRWMAIVPVLIVGFYMMYVMKTAWLAERGPLLRRLVALIVLACVCFTGWSWVENHLLSLDQGAWSTMYTAKSTFYANPTLAPRLGVLAFGALPTMAMLVAWQILGTPRVRAAAGPRDLRRLAAVAIIGLAGVAACSTWYVSVADERTRSALTGRLVGGYLVLALLGIVMQIVGWKLMLQRGRFSVSRLTAASIGLGLTILSMTVVREGIRLAHVDITALYAQHQDALGRGGMWVFLAFLAINAGLIAWAIRIGRRAIVDKVAVATQNPEQGGHEAVAATPSLADGPVDQVPLSEPPTLERPGPTPSGDVTT
jgi:hypothetical protein